MPSALEPLPSTERIPLLDILRGFAIFGILVVNMSVFMAPDFLPSYVSSPLPWYDRLVEFLETLPVRPAGVAVAQPHLRKSATFIEAKGS